MSITPTVGRVIWYYPGEQDPGNRNGNEPLDAHIIAVWPDGTINLVIFDIRGMLFHRENVVITEAPEAGCAMWMPYQTGQAAKTEEAEAKLKADTGAKGKK